MDTVTLYRPTGPEELELVKESGYKEWPPRLPDQPIFYPVTNEEYAKDIAVEWNIKDSKVGFVTKFEVKKIFMDKFTIGGKEFASRLIIGTGKYKTFELMKDALEASGADMITVAVRRVNISDRSKESLLDYIDTKKYTILPNTAGCYNVDDAVRTAMLAREAGLSNLIKLEVIGDPLTLLPDVHGLLEDH